jgi:hypothetical protein
MQELLQEILDLERESHRLLDESFVNLVFANPGEEGRERYIQQRYKAAELHSLAVDKIKQLQQLYRELSS